MNICKLLESIAEIGELYGNLRLENIMIVLDTNAKMIKVKYVKFLNLSICHRIAESENITIPDKIDHIPPFMLRHLLKIKRFENNE